MGQEANPQKKEKVREETSKMLENLNWLGHASFKITGEKIIYIDPYQLKEESEKADIILITHSHFDHCSPLDVEKIQKSNTVIVATPDCKSSLSGNIKTVKQGDKITIGGINIETVPAYNINKRYHSKSNNWVGYIVTVNGKRIYHAGDTDKIPVMADIKADIALLPVGGTYTMTAEEAADAANLIKPKLAVPMHFGSVVGSKSDAERFKNLCKVPVEILTPVSGK